MSRSSKTHLSKHLLEMKFMKRTALRIETQAHESEQQIQIDEEHWALDVPELKQKQSCFIMEPSHVWCESLKFGRMAFKGFNPEIEKLMKSMDTEQELALAEEREKEISVSDTEMAERYSSLVGTIGKKYSRKRKRKPSTTDSDESDSEKYTEIEENVTMTLAKLRKEGERETTNRHSNLDDETDKLKCKNIDSIEEPLKAQHSIQTKSISSENENAAESTVVTIDIANESNPEISSPVSSKKIKTRSSVLEYYSKKKKDKSKSKFMKPKDD